MRQKHITTVRLASLALVVLGLANWSIAPEQVRPSAAAPSSTLMPLTEGDSSRVRQAFGKLPLYFVENRGQLDAKVAYYVQGSDKTVYFAAQGLTFSLTHKEATAQLTTSTQASALSTRHSVKRWALKLDFVGANPHVRPIGKEATSASINYFKGPQANWKADLKTYRSIVYQDLWPGIDLVYTGTASQLKYTFLVKPGADPERIRLAYRGANEVKLNAVGQLEVIAPVGSFRDEQPSSYQEVNGQRVEIATTYALAPKRKASAQTYGFRVGGYDRSKLLVLDPAVFIYSGYLGGSNNDPALKIAVDGAGNAYVTGMTSSQSTFPKTVGPQLNYQGNFFDAYVVKVNAAGTALVYAGYIGGAGNETGFSIAVDNSGSAYITGSTTSTESTFPVLGGPRLNYKGGTFFGDAFVAKVKPDGTGLVYCGYIGGSEDDFGLDIAVDSSGNAYVTGETASSQSSFPVTVGPDLSFNGGASDAFVAKVNAAGAGLVYCGYLGGSSDDSAASIAVDGAGNTYVAGATASSQASFPVSVGPDLTHNGEGDAFVAKVNVGGTALVYCGYLGGSSNDAATGIAVDNGGNAYLTGNTRSLQASFPVNVGPDLSFNGGDFFGDAFVAKVSANGTALVYCGYIGGAGEDVGTDIALDSAGNAYLTGATTSTESSFPVRGGANATYKGGSLIGDAFVAKVNAAGSDLTWVTYFGGAGDDGGTGIALDSLGYVYVTGGTDSSEATFPVMLGPDLSYNSTQDGFVAKLVPIAFFPASGLFASGGGSGSVAVTVPANFTWTAASNNSFITITSGNGSTGNGTVSYTVAGNAAVTPRTGTLTIAGQSFAVNQNGTSCAGLISPNSAFFTAGVGGGSVTVPAPSGCNWTAISNAPWLTITAGSSGNGAGMVSYAVAANTEQLRTGTLTIASQSFTVNQDRCTFMRIDPATLQSGFIGRAYDQTFTQVGGNGTITWSVSAGVLPAGLALNATTGELTGTPSATGSFSFTIKATDAGNCTIQRPYTLVISGTGLMFYPLAYPVRLLDTRPGQVGCDAPGQPVVGGTSRTQTAAGRNCSGIAIPASARALAGNITTVESGGGYLTLYPSDAAQPLVANSNYGSNEVLNNVFTVGLGNSDGAFKLFVTSTTNIVIDVTGYYAPPGAGGLYFHPLLKPIRLLETRAGFTGCNTPSTPLPGNADTLQPARLTCDGVTIPATAQAIVGNATTVNPGGGYLTLFPANAARPLVASSNYLPGQVMNAPFTVGLSPAGQFNIYATSQTDLVVDVLGYYSVEASDANGLGLLFNPLSHPVRLLETRAGFGGCFTPGAPLLGGSTRTQLARGLCDGVQLAAAALGIVGNATVVNASGGYLTFWPSSVAQPLVATSNFSPGQIFNRHFTVGLGAGDGAFKIYTPLTTDLVLDVSGYFAP